MKRGDIFTHRHWLNPETNQPLRCKITKVAGGTLYYRPHYGFHDDGSEWLGKPMYFPVADSAKYIAS